jgi:hypothetical protein
MRTVRTLLPMVAMLLLLFAARSAKANCWEYFDWGSVDCTGLHGCMSQWEEIGCTFGCISGSCNPTGNSTECCGTRHDYAAGHDDGQGGCSGVNCGNVRFRVHARASHLSSPHSAELLQGYTPGLVMLSADLSYKSTQLVYTFNRCNHSYEAVVEDGGVLAREGM